MAERIRCLVCDGAGYHIIGHLDAVKGPDEPIPTEKRECPYCNGTGYLVIRDRKFDQVKKMSVSDLAMAAAKEVVAMSIHIIQNCPAEYLIEGQMPATSRSVIEHKLYHHYLQLLQMPEEEENHGSQINLLPRL